MSARERILGRLRGAQPPFSELAPIAERRNMVPPQALNADERLAQFTTAAESLGCFVYQLDENSAIEQIMELLAGDDAVLSWDELHLPMPGLHGMLASLGVGIAPHADGDARVGITAVSAALAATGSLVLESGAGRHRATSLLPDLHIALMRADQILPDLETWTAAQAGQGNPAFKRSSNTVIVTGPSKTADIGHQLVKGAHGPRELHILVLPAARGGQ